MNKLFFVFKVLDDMQSAIKVGTCKLGLQPGAAFQARVAQLAELVKAHKLVRFKLLLLDGTLMYVIIPREGLIIKLLYLEVSPLTFVKTICNRKGTPSVYVKLKNGSRFAY